MSPAKARSAAPWRQVTVTIEDPDAFQHRVLFIILPPADRTC